MSIVRRPITLLLVDDHQLARSGVRQFLCRDRHIKIVGEADSAKQAVDLIGQLQPDVVLLDIRLGQDTGLDVVRVAKTEAPDTRMLILTTYDDDRYIRASVKLGAVGYLLKTTSPDELRRAVHNAAAGSLVFAQEIAAKVTGLLSGHDGGIGARGTHVNGHLTTREAEVLECMGRGLKNREIADALGVSLKTVETHVKHVLQKLGVTSRTQAVVCALKNGWLSGSVA